MRKREGAARTAAARKPEDSLQTLRATRFRAQAQMMAALTDHPVLVGTGRENAVGALLHELLPRRFEVLTGIIAQLDDAGEPVREGPRPTSSSRTRSTSPSGCARALRPSWSPTPCAR